MANMQANLEPHVFFKIFCTFPAILSTSQLKPKYEKVSKKNVVFMACFAINVLLFVFAAVMHTKDVLETKQVTRFFIGIIKILVAGGCLIMTFLGRQKLVECLNWALEFDTKLKTLGMSKQYRFISGQKLFKTTAAAVISIANIVATIKMASSDLTKTTLNYITYNLTHINTTLITLQFSTFLFILMQHFQNVNSTLTRIVVDTNRKLKQGHVEDLKRLTELHCNLCTASGLINDTYEKQILLIIVRTFIEFLNGFHTLFENGDASLVTYDLFWCLLAVCELLTVLEPCSATEQASKQTGLILNMMKIEDEKENIERNMFLLQSHHQTVNFTASGYFPLKHSIFLDIVYTTTSYLIVIKQFEYAK